MSTDYDHEPLKFMVTQRKPNSVFLKMVEPTNVKEDEEGQEKKQRNNLYAVSYSVFRILIQLLSKSSKNVKLNINLTL